jgi:hypothetical protein
MSRTPGAVRHRAGAHRRAAAPAVRRADIEGAWAYHRWRITYEDGRVTEPFGADASGLLLYTADGFMSACIMAGDRQPFASANPRAATLRERAAAYDSYFSYAGRWRLVRGVVEHIVSVAANPAMVGTSQFRHARLSGRRLVLSAEETTARGLRSHELEWHRPSSRRSKQR